MVEGGGVRPPRSRGGEELRGISVERRGSEERVVASGAPLRQEGGEAAHRGWPRSSTRRASRPAARPSSYPAPSGSTPTSRPNRAKPSAVTPLAWSLRTEPGAIPPHLPPRSAHIKPIQIHDLTLNLYNV